MTVDSSSPYDPYLIYVIHGYKIVRKFLRIESSIYKYSEGTCMFTRVETEYCILFLHFITCTLRTDMYTVYLSLLTLTYHFIIVECPSVKISCTFLQSRKRFRYYAGALFFAFYLFLVKYTINYNVILCNTLHNKF